MMDNVRHSPTEGDQPAPHPVLQRHHLVSDSDRFSDLGDKDEQSFERIVRGLSEVGMLYPFYVFVEIHKPIRGLSFLVFEGFEPLFRAVCGREFSEVTHTVLSSEENYESLLRYLGERT